MFVSDEDGVLSFQELNVVMKSLGQRPSGAHKKMEMLLKVPIKKLCHTGLLLVNQSVYWPLIGCLIGVLCDVIFLYAL